MKIVPSVLLGIIASQDLTQILVQLVSIAQKVLVMFGRAVRRVHLAHKQVWLMLRNVHLALVDFTVPT